MVKKIKGIGSPRMHETRPNQGLSLRLGQPGRNSLETRNSPGSLGTPADIDDFTREGADIMLPRSRKSPPEFASWNAISCNSTRGRTQRLLSVVSAFKYTSGTYIFVKMVVKTLCYYLFIRFYALQGLSPSKGSVSVEVVSE